MNSKISYSDFRNKIREGLYERAVTSIEENTEEYMGEAAKNKTVIRGGKRMRKKVTDKEGYKMVDGREVKMDAAEKRTRKIAAKKAARKGKSKRAAASKKRARSMARR